MGSRTVRFDGIIVAVGQFNPAIVTPDWLLRHGLIPESDLEDCLAKLQALVQEGLMSFDSSWFSFRLVQNQMVLSTLAGATPRLRDLAVGILKILPETPISALGINFASDVQFDSSDEYHKFGDTLVPKDIWRSIYPGKNSGLSSLQVAIDNSSRTGEQQPAIGQDQRRFTVQPSNIVSPNAVHVAFNHHYPVSDKDGARGALQVLESRWEGDQQEAEDSCLKLISLTQ